MRAALRALRVDALTAEVTAVLADAGVRAILLKGPAIATWLYERPSDRPYRDCDLLVAPDDHVPTEAILRDLGFSRYTTEVSPGDWKRHATAWCRPDGAVIDLHRHLTGIGAPDATLWDAWSRDTTTLPVAGRTVEVLAPSARAALVALYAAKDGAKGGRALADLDRALHQVPDELWREAAARAEEVGASGAFATGLRMLAEGAALAERLALTTRRSTEVALRATGAPPLAVGLTWLTSDEATIRTKVAVVARKVVPPPEFLRSWSPLARRSRLGLAASYLWRPLWLALRAGPAARSWWRAREESRRLP